MPSNHPNKHIREAIRYAESKGWTVMKGHEFTLILTTDPNEEEADRLYSIFDDGTLATIAGVPQIHFHREALSLEGAINSALANVRKAGFDVVRVEIEPKAVTQEAQVFQVEQLHATIT
ncbi:MAG: hypothetical protein ACE5PV_06080 [Candidatus Poribacteria bacterium]